MPLPRPHFIHNQILKNIWLGWETFKETSNAKFGISFLGIDVIIDKKRFLPDLFAMTDKSRLHDSYYSGAPTLVVQVQTPPTAKYNLTVKKDLYEKGGVKEYWVVSPEEQSLTVWKNVGGKLEIAAYMRVPPSDTSIDDYDEYTTLYTTDVLGQGLQVDIWEIFDSTKDLL
ncbi:MAG: Uma2 family endonuclease [Oscillospiraceae bacterium]|nr:Uma2 family endonuclease [Oscillospiraceae bacterium]